MPQPSEIAPARFQLRAISAVLLRPVERRPSLRYWIGLGFAALCTLIGAAAWGRQLYIGMGVSGLAWPAMWAMYITCFVFWIGIAHSGTLISAILYLFRAKFRPSFSRAAEAMTIFAIATAGLFPILHLGRAWRFYWVFPYPNQRRLWINFRSPLVLVIFAISTYLTVSLIFWYLGMVPDFAEIRDRSTGWRRTAYGALSLGWVGSLLPCWHEEIFPPYFVAGAIFSGLAMVLTLIIPLRSWFHLEEHITRDHLEALAKLIILTSSIVAYSYATEYFTAWYSGDNFERTAYWMRAFGHYWKPFWLMSVCNVLVPLLFFFRRVRRSIAGLL